MRFRSLGKWDNREESKGLIFVAQLIDELMFDYTLDTYKPSAMNTALLIKEAVTTIKAIDAGVVMKPNLAHILNELCENLKSDEVAQLMMTVDIEGVTTILKNPKSSDGSVATVVELLMRQVPLRDYKAMTEAFMLLELRTSQDRSKLRKLTRSYITTLLNYGYTDKYIRKVSQQFFHYSSDRITDNNAITAYFEKFAVNAVEFDVVYKAPEYFKEFAEAAERLGILVSGDLEEIPISQDEIARNKLNLGAGEVFLFIAKVKGKEPNIVKLKADRKLETIQTLIGLYHHKESRKSITDCLVRNSETGVCTKISRHTNPMHKCHDTVQTVASKKLSSFMKAFSLQPESFAKFHRSAELHSLALASESVENQMINLWIALESLIPNNTDKDTAQIDHLANSIMPFLNLEYVNKLLTRFSKDLLTWNAGVVRRMYKAVDAKGVVSKTAHLLALSKYDHLRKDLEESFGDFHLLRDRYQHLQKILSSPKLVVDVLDAHSKRVAWQLRRIYRARNTIVHDGSTPSYTEILVENTHDYLDSVMRWLMALASSENTIHTVAQGFKMVELNYGSYKKKLSQKGLTFDEGNIDSLMFSFHYLR
ncbi:hypothetical protein BZK31_26640 [Pseudomonas floridensis]|uniref:Apea-like HEPN domain-containing protein n=1 Tax=Pseudomonas floridensis TaxID=1958950 RepID=A0A1X0MY39_9PSED|nr:hypothetical protein [Pseudomonas floridensis]MEE4574628.1 hypothetical protein [Pseudomonas alliivorans]MEE4803610.1 hypothetical protein [Pseudomonas alliivorans]ORC53994.1 hypothetical protein BZK31_26640 [Pseudomonas floridensis]